MTRLLLAATAALCFATAGVAVAQTSPMGNTTAPATAMGPSSSMGNSMAHNTLGPATHKKPHHKASAMGNSMSHNTMGPNATP